MKKRRDVFRDELAGLTRDWSKSKRKRRKEDPPRSFDLTIYRKRKSK